MKLYIRTESYCVIEIGGKTYPSAVFRRDENGKWVSISLKSVTSKFLGYQPFEAGFKYSNSDCETLDKWIKEGMLKEISKMPTNKKIIG